MLALASEYDAIRRGRNYVFTDDHCVNQVFAGSGGGTPALAPRVVRGTLARTQDTGTLEFTPNMGPADLIADLVTTGTTM